MPRSSQIIPTHLYPHSMVVINDNTEYLSVPSSDAGNTNMLFVFASPKGKDGMQTITDGLAGFEREYGIGPFSLYGQPLLNAYTAASSGAATLHCLRVTDPAAAYSYITICAKYKIEDAKMTVRFYAKSNPDTELTDLDTLDQMYVPSDEPDADGFSEVALFSAAYRGRGTFGDNVRVRIVNAQNSDRENSYKNYYVEVYVNEYGLNKKEEFLVVFNEDALVSGVSLFSDTVINDPDSGSDWIKFVTNLDGFATLFNAYKDANPDTVLTINDFDPLLGVNKYTRNAIENYEIDTTTEGVVSLNALGGISFVGGNDAGLAASAPAEERKALLTTLYKKAFSGEIDPYIKSKNKYPTNIILDAGFDPDIKQLIAALAIARTDCVAILDCGTGISTKQSVLDYVRANLNATVINRVHSIEGYCGKVRDPYTKKIVTVTGTWYLASAYPIHFQTYEAKHVPLAGNTYGVFSGFIKNSVYPVFDEDIDSDLMDELCEERINFARNNIRSDIIRATQTTRQAINSNLSELNNVFILLDIKRDCEKICAQYEFNFSEASDIARFNGVARDLLNTYSVAQVRSISAHFDKNAWEAERGILHLYVEFVNKDLVKTTIIEIDVNR